MVCMLLSCSTWCTRRFIIGSEGSRLPSTIDFCHDCSMAAHNGRVHGCEFYLQRIGVCTGHRVCQCGSVAHIFLPTLVIIISFALSFFHVTTNNSQFILFHLTRIRYFVASIDVHHCLKLCYPSIIPRCAWQEEKNEFKLFFYKYSVATAQAMSMSKSLDIRAD